MPPVTSRVLPKANAATQRPTGFSPFRAMFTYDTLIALYPTWLGAVGGTSGLLLWPGVGLHATVALWLVRTWRDGRLSKTGHQ